MCSFLENSVRCESDGEFPRFRRCRSSWNSSPEDLRLEEVDWGKVVKLARLYTPDMRYRKNGSNWRGLLPRPVGSSLAHSAMTTDRRTANCCQKLARVDCLVQYKPGQKMPRSDLPRPRNHSSARRGIHSGNCPSRLPT